MLVDYVILSRHDGHAAAIAAGNLTEQELVETVQRTQEKRNDKKASPARRLAVVVPTHTGDFKRTVASFAKWPQRCHESTLQHADLIVYYAGRAGDRVKDMLPSLAETGGRCFANTQLVLANLTKQVRNSNEAAATTAAPC